MAGGGALERLRELPELRVAPTKRVRPRAALACNLDRAATVPVTSKTGVGISSPFTGMLPSGRTWT